MEWIILVVLVPAVIVPVVLLFGFAGCAALIGIEPIEFKEPDKPPLPPPPPPPKIVTKTRHTFYDAAKAVPPTGQADSSPVPLMNRCLVQLFAIDEESPGAPWSAEASVWEVTIRASSVGSLTIGQASVSLSLGGPDSDVVNPLESIIDGGTLGAGGNAVEDATGVVTVPVDGTGVLQKEYGLGVTLPVKKGGFLLVAFNVLGGAGRHWSPIVPAGKTAPVGFIKQRDATGAPDAMAPKRTFNLATDTQPGVSLIEKIEFIEYS